MECLSKNRCLRCARQHSGQLGIRVFSSEMTDKTHILKVEKDGHDGLIVTFSDDTTAGYVAEELLLLRSHRELTHEPGEHKTPQNQ